MNLPEAVRVCGAVALRVRLEQLITFVWSKTREQENPDLLVIVRSLTSMGVGYLEKAHGRLIMHSYTVLL